MVNSDADSAPRRQSSLPIRRLAVVAALAVLGTSALVRSTSAVDPATGIGALGVVSALAAVLVWYRSATASSGDEATDGETDVWEAIPSRQYEGRHAESGGIARGEQERALQDIQQQVDELTDDPSQP